MKFLLKISFLFSFVLITTIKAPTQWITDYEPYYMNPYYINVTDTGTMPAVSKIYKTTDYGNSWQLYTPYFGINGFANNVLNYVLQNISHYYLGEGTGFLFGVDIDPDDDVAGITSPAWKHACGIYANTFNIGKFGKLRSNSINYIKNSNLEISLTSNKNEYFQMEPIWITAQIKNIGSDIDSVDLIGSIDLLPNIIIYDSNGLRLPYHYFLVQHSARHLIKLKPNEQTSFDMELSIGFGNISVSEKYHLLSYFSEDKYNAELKFHNYLNHETAISNNIEFTVKAHTGIELNNFNNLIQTTKKYDITLPDWKSYIKDLKDFFTNNQNSIYTERVYYNYIHQVALLQKDKDVFNLKFIDECKDFYDKYPNSFYSEDILKSVLPPYVRILKKSKQSFQDLLNDLISKYPNTKIQAAALKLSGDEKLMNKLFKKF